MRGFKYVRLFSLIELYVEWDSDKTEPISYECDRDGACELWLGPLYVCVNRTKAGARYHGDKPTQQGDPLHRRVP